MSTPDLSSPLMRSIINCFESGTPETDYSSIFVYRDGPKNQQQLTLGWGITESSDLKELIEGYIKSNGVYADKFKPYLSTIGTFSGGSLAFNKDFLSILKDATHNDPLMRKQEDIIWDKNYFIPALGFFNHHKFSLPLTFLLILDSYVHSGGVPLFLRDRFPECTPDNDGEEKLWVLEYVCARKSWLYDSHDPLNKTIYRMRFFEDQILNNNWDLSVRPVYANGVRLNN